jgi:carboxymethylenebutenolidase
MATPEGGNGPALLLIHAWWGLNPFITGLADRLAEAGFLVLAPDLYRGQVAMTIEEAEQMRAEMSKGPVTKSDLLTGALDYLKRSAPKGSKMGVVGFSMGASWAMWLAANRADDVSAAVLFYGTRQIDAARGTAAFQGHFASTDRYVKPAAVRNMEQALQDAGRDIEFFVYPDTGHWFFEDDRSDAYNKDAAEQAWERMIVFLHDRLK